MYPIFFSIGKVNFYTHGLMIAIGCLAGGLLMFYLAKKEKLPTKFLFDLLVLSLFAGIIGARATYVIFYYYQFENWFEMLFVWYGGLISFGGIIFGFLAAGLILKRKKQNILRWFDLGIIGLLVGWAFGRIGCLLSGDVLGIISSSGFAIWGRVPAALLESAWSLIVAGLLFYIYVFKQNIRRKFSDGFIFLVGLALYAAGRFWVDFFREENVFYFLKGGQIASIILLIAMVIILILKYFRRGVDHA